MGRVVPFALAIAVSFTATACLPVTTSSPIGTTTTVKADPLLPGMWKGRIGDSSNAAYITFFPHDDGTMAIVLLSPPSTGENGGWNVFEARSVALGTYRYLDARQIDDEGKPPDPKLAHVPVLYRVGDDGSLVLYLIDDAVARTAVKAGKIAGTVEAGEFGDVVITASPSALDAYLQGVSGRALFTRPWGNFQRAR